LGIRKKDGIKVKITRHTNLSNDDSRWKRRREEEMEGVGK